VSRRFNNRGNRILLGLAAATVLWLALASRIHVNASWSDDAWGYFVLPLPPPGRGNSLARGDIVVFDPPDALGAPVPYLKIVRGVPGDTVVVDADRGVWIAGEHLGRAKSFSLTGRALDAIEPATIPPTYYFLNANHPDSHDSRYAEIGLVPRDRIRGRAIALPDIPWLGLEGPPLARGLPLARGNPSARSAPPDTDNWPKDAGFPQPEPRP